MANSGSRLGYLDWLRGLTVLVMIEAHTFDAWTRPEDKTREVYGWLMVLGGMAAPAFLFMAGVAVALAAASRLRRGATPAEVLITVGGKQALFNAALALFDPEA